ncbi:MAG: tetratricopeptide repeat protein [Pseudomonadota bacterium]
MIATRLFNTLLLGILFCTLPACLSDNKKKENHYLKALEYSKVADDKAAIIELKNAIQLDAKFADARYQLGLLYLKGGDPRAAFAELQRAASLDPKNLDAVIKVAEFHLLSRNKEECRKFTEQALSIDPEYVDGLALLANLELIESNVQKAQEAIDKALKKAPENDKLYNIKGRILTTDNKWEDGEKQFQKAIELSPENFNNYQTLLMLYEQRKDDQAIQKLLTTMQAKFPDNPQLQLLLAGIFQKKGELDKAEEALLHAIDLQKESIQLRMTLAEFYKNHQQFDKAEKSLQDATTAFPKDLQLQVALAELQFDLQKFTEARTLMDAVLKTNPANGGANLIKARFFIREGKNEEAIQTITPLLSDYPKWAEPFYFSALTHLRIGKVELALKAIELALRNNPGNDRYHALAAQIHLVKGSSADAGKEAVIALKINQHNFIAVKILVQSLVQGKEFEKAVKLIEAIDSKVIAGDADLLGAKGMAYLGMKNVDKAKQSFTSLLALVPGNTKALGILAALTAGNDINKAIAFVTDHIAKHPEGGHYLLLGELYFKSKNNDKALQAFEKAQELSPENPQGYVLRAHLLNLMGKTEETISQYNELLQTQPNSISALMGLAAAYESLGRFAEAKAKYQRALELRPDLPAAANNLAWLIASEDKGDLGEALRLAMQAKQALPDQPNIADTLGWVHYKRSSYSLAITQFKQALENRPEDPTIRYHLALAQYANGDKPQAIALLEQVLAGDTGFKEKDEAKATLQSWR